MSEKVISKLDSIITFLKPYHSFIASHMVSFITDSLYDNIFPSHLKIDNQFDLDLILKQFWHHGKGELFLQPNSELQRFLNEILDMSLENDTTITRKISDFKKNLYDNGCKPSKSFYFGEFMNAKKSHEVEVMSSLIAELSSFCNCNYLIDIGDGKGYLSSLLALEYKLKILGVDASAVKTEGATKRNKKLLKVWEGCRKKYVKEECNIPLDPVSGESYRRKTEFISESTRMGLLIRSEFPDCHNYGLVGLHTCGDLSMVCIQKFTSDPDQTFLVNVGCCYHLLTEGFNKEDGFPMSVYLKDKGFSLGRNARMLSLKALPRVASLQTLPNESLLYRAILEKIFLDKLDPMKEGSTQVGRIGAKCSNFNEYVRKAFAKLNIDVPISDWEIDRYYKTYEGEKPKLWIYFMLMSSFSKVIESVILLDRLLYLKEQGIENSFLVEMFDPVISPRCYGIIGFRNR